ncbi:hypothetical protein CJF32_00006039 [Rutstroemia sp. NJR-2017a WRK4]|nr:hypothetical protein CJF32_00006039 [Rutstroemia sp. NJR-2017a WRK4]
MISPQSQTPHSHYHYDPSLAAAIIFSVLYSITFLISLYQWIRYKAGVWAIMVFAAAMEAIGYIVRAISTQHTFNDTLYVIQFTLIFLSPVFMAAACYIVFGRIIYHVVPKEACNTKLLWISPRFVTPTFVLCDIVALLLQLSGAIKFTSIDPSTPNAQSEIESGRNVALAGVSVQLACFGLFTIIAGRFNFTSKQVAKDFTRTEVHEMHETGQYMVVDGSGGKKLKRNWKALLRVVNGTCALILVRSVYRMVEFAMGSQGYVETHEWCTYIWDALVMLTCLALFNYWHPANYLPYMQWRLPKHAR